MRSTYSATRPRREMPGTMQRQKLPTSLARVQPSILMASSRRPLSILGLGRHSHTLGSGLLFGPLVYVAYWALMLWVVGPVGLPAAIAYAILVFYVPALVFLTASWRTSGSSPTPPSQACAAESASVYSVGTISVAYLATYGAAFLLEQPREPSMVGLYQFKTNFQVAVLIVSLLLLPPIVEELASGTSSCPYFRLTPASGSPAWR